MIASVLPFGFFAQLEEIRVDGMVHISNLQDDYYIYDQLAQKLVGEHKGKVYSVGDEILIRISKVDLELYRVDFQLVGTLKSSRSSQRLYTLSDSQIQNKKTTAVVARRL